MNYNFRVLWSNKDQFQFADRIPEKSQYTISNGIRSLASSCVLQRSSQASVIPDFRINQYFTSSPTKNIYLLPLHLRVIQPMKNIFWSWDLFSIDSQKDFMSTGKFCTSFFVGYSYTSSLQNLSDFVTVFLHISLSKIYKRRMLYHISIINMWREQQQGSGCSPRKILF